jgi:hypothetical protein
MRSVGRKVQKVKTNNYRNSAQTLYFLKVLSDTPTHSEYENSSVSDTLFCNNPCCSEHANESVTYRNVKIKFC